MDRRVWFEILANYLKTKTISKEKPLIKKSKIHTLSRKLEKCLDKVRHFDIK
ncbi:hypothetical protein HOE04_03995 [archaeon]|nr:hypothetical protein [archaeon]